MPAAARAGDFDAAHSEAAVVVFFDGLLAGWRVETRPSAVRVKLSVGGEEFLSTGGAEIGAIVFVERVLASEGAIGAFLAQDVVLLGREFALPFFVGLMEFIDFFGHTRLDTREAKGVQGARGSAVGTWNL